MKRRRRSVKLRLKESPPRKSTSARPKKHGRRS
jgi:hypothetical protein